MIGKMLGKVFEVKTKAIVNKLQTNPKVHNAVKQYKKDTDEFKKRIDDLGIGSWDDLIAASKKDPNVRDGESARDQMDRLRRELGIDQDPHGKNAETSNRSDWLLVSAKSTTQTKKKKKVQPKKTVKSPKSEPTKPKTAVKKATAIPASYISEIRELASLRDDGIITDEEFETKKKNLLKQ